MGSAADAGRDDLSRQPYGSHRIESHRDRVVSGRVWHHPDRASLPVSAAKRGKAQRACKDRKDAISNACLRPDGRTS